MTLWKICYCLRVILRVTTPTPRELFKLDTHIDSPPLEPPRPSLIRPLVRDVLFSCVLLAAFPSTLSAQSGPEYLPGKAYVIRVTPFTDDQETLGVYMANVREGLTHIGGMIQHISDNLYSMKAAEDDRWFIGFFHADRQAKEDLMRDLDLLVWLFHGHNVQIMPIEKVKSPDSYLITPPPAR